MDKVKKYVDELYEHFFRMSHQYNEYAKKFHETLYSLSAFSLLYENEKGLSQRQISEALFLPKQTVRSIIIDFEKRGFVSSMQSPKDGRSRIHFLTVDGKRYCDKMINSLIEAECRCMGQLEEEDVVIMIQTNKKYMDFFDTEIERIKKE